MGWGTNSNPPVRGEAKCRMARTNCVALAPAGGRGIIMYTKRFRVRSWVGAS